MTQKQEMVMTLLSEVTIKKVKEQFKSGMGIISLECFEMSFRLFKAKDDSINLELLIQMPIETSEKQNIPGFGSGRIQKAVMFYKPIGYYTPNKDFSSTEIEVTVLKEFENELDFLIKSRNFPINIKINKLSLEANALLAAFSMEALMNAEKNKDCSFHANGLDLDIFMTLNNGYPQSFLDDKYGLHGHIGAYFLKGTDKRIDMNIIYEGLFRKLYGMSLMTVYKRI